MLYFFYFFSIIKFTYFFAVSSLILLEFSSVCLFPVNYNFQKKVANKLLPKATPKSISCTHHHLIAWTFPFFFFYIFLNFIDGRFHFDRNFFLFYSHILSHCHHTQYGNYCHKSSIRFASVIWIQLSILGTKKEEKKTKLKRRAKPSNWNAHKILKIKIFTKRWAKIKRRKKQTNKKWAKI